MQDADVFFSDFGRFTIPLEIGAQLARVPRRKVRVYGANDPTANGYDRRFRAGRAAVAWERRQNARIQALWMDGREGEFRFEPFEAA